MSKNIKSELWAHQKEALERAKTVKSLAIFHEIGCLSAHTKIKVNRNKISRTYTIEELYRKFNNVEISGKNHPWTKKSKSYARSWNGERIQLNEIVRVVRSGTKEVFDLELRRPHTAIRATKDHEVLTDKGFVELGKLKPGDRVAIDTLRRHQKKKEKTAQRKPRYSLNQIGLYHKYGRKGSCHHTGKPIKVMERHRIVYEAHLNGMSFDEYREATRRPNKLKFIDPSKFHIHHKNHKSKDDRIENLECLTVTEHLKSHGKNAYKHFGHGEVSYSEVKRIVPRGPEMTYDLQMKDPHRNFVANNIVVHNCGKTRSQIEILSWHISQGRNKILIFAPPVVLFNWQRELLSFSDIPEHNIHVLYGPGKKRALYINELQTKSIKNKNLPYIIITNYETTQITSVYQKLIFMKFDVLVLDECHLLKDYRAKRTKQILQLSKEIPYKYGLTGTPVLNTPMDLFSQYMILFGMFPTFKEQSVDNFFSFRNRYFYDKNAGMPSHVHFPKWLPKPKTVETFNTIIKKTAVIAKKSECLDLPPFINERRDVELGKEQKRAYDEMYRDFITYIEDEACVAQLAIVKGLKLMQIVSGFLQVNEETTHRFKENPRLKLLEDLLLELTPNHKVIVWATFKDNYKTITELCLKHGIKMAHLHGEVSTREKFEAADRFNKVEDCRVMIANQMAGGIGVNLTASDTSIYFSRDFKLGGDIQSEGRNYRGGSEIHDKVTRIDIIAKDTIDELVLESLSNKEVIGENLLRRIKNARVS